MGEAPRDPMPRLLEEVGSTYWRKVFPSGRRQEPETQAQRELEGHAAGSRRLEGETGHPQVALGPWKEAL